MALGGVIRDVTAYVPGAGRLAPYVAVYALEVILLITAIVTMVTLFRVGVPASGMTAGHKE